MMLFRSIRWNSWIRRQVGKILFILECFGRLDVGIWNFSCIRSSPERVLGPHRYAFEGLSDCKINPVLDNAWRSKMRPNHEGIRNS